MAIENPMSRAGKHPCGNHHVSANARQTQHSRAVGLEIVKIGHNRDINAWLKEQRLDDCFFQRALRRIGALTLRDDDSKAFGHAGNG
jgi:hypothetical protein